MPAGATDGAADPKIYGFDGAYFIDVAQPQVSAPGEIVCWSNRMDGL
jgi:hypothetical protein